MKIRKAFTLIELLVVIAIIALLLSIVLPSLRKVKEHAKMMICATNQRSILQAVVVYSAENDGKLPPSIQGRPDGWWTLPVNLKYNYGTDLSINGGDMFGILGDYMKSAKYFDCPMSNHDSDWQDRFMTGAMSQSTDVIHLGSSYMMFWNWLKFASPSPSHKSFKPTDQGGDGLMICDLITYNEPVNNAAHGGNMWMSSHPWARAAKMIFHSGTASNPGSALNEEYTVWMEDDPTGVNVPDVKLNAGYIDGHVETFKMEAFEQMSQESQRMYNIYWLPVKRR